MKMLTSKHSSQLGQSINFIVFILFFFSGAFALIYEVSWVRAITLEFGSTTLAISTVLTIFMGGLALGARIVLKKVDAFVAPLTKYGYIECGIGLYALLTPAFFKWLLPLFSLLGAKYGDSIWFISILRFFVISLFLLPPTVLMGTTLPILARFYANYNRDSAKGAGLLYGVNTIGAFVGTFIVGFVLLPYLGLSQTVIYVSACNILQGMVALIVGLKVEAIPKAYSDSAVKKTLFEQQVDSKHKHPVLLAIALTGFAAMACEVIWTRVLILVIGASVYAFSIVLFTFLAGLGIGSAVFAAFLRSNRSKAVIVFYWLALTAAVFVFISSSIFQYLPTFFLNLFWDWDVSHRHNMVLLTQVLISAIVMFIPSFIMGGLFPTAARIMVQESKRTGQRIANLYIWNTTGSIVGSFSAGFLLIPIFGINGSITMIIAFYFFGAIICVLGKEERSRHSFRLAAGGAVFLIILLLMPSWHRQVMTSGMYNYAYRLPKMGAKELTEYLKNNYKLLYYKDGLSATVTVTQTISSEIQQLGITINGKYDGSSHNDIANQRLLSHMPLLFHPDPKEVCVIGMGTGCTAGSAALYPLEKVTVVEIESAVVEAARLFKDHNYSVHENVNVDIRITDGRLFLRMHPNRFDVIISEPSNPWQAGSSDLFTVEYFTLGSKALREEGLFCQWVQMYSLSSENIKTILRTFTKVFPHTYIITSSRSLDMLLLGSKDSFTPNLDQARKRMQEKNIYADLADPRVNIKNIYDLAARIRMGPNEVHDFMGNGKLHTDDLPVLSYDAPKDLYRKIGRENEMLIGNYARGICPYLQVVSTNIDEKKKNYQNLAFAYQKFLPGGKEREVCEQFAEE